MHDSEFVFMKFATTVTDYLELSFFDQWNGRSSGKSMAIKYDVTL